MTILKHNTLLFITLLLFTSCNFRAAINPISYTPACSDCSWTPKECDKPPIPDCLLMESADCKECPDSEIEGPLNLVSLLDIALARSPLTRETWAKSRISASRYGTVQTDFYPKVDFEAYWEALKEPSLFQGSNLFIRQFQDYGPLLNISYLVLDFGTTRAISTAFYRQLVASNWLHNREVQTVIETVTIDYYNLIADQQKVIASEANLNDANTTLAATETKHDSGISDITDVYTAQTQVAKEMIQLLTDEQSEVDARATLLADAGLPSNLCVEIETFSEEIDENAFLQTIDHYICLAYELRPDLQAAYAQVLGDESFVKAAQRNQLPKINFDGTFGQINFNGNVRSQYDYATKFTLTYPLFHGWYYTNQIREAKARLELSKAQLRDVEVQMVKEVVTSYQDFAFATQIVAVNKEYVELAAKTFVANLSEYKVGTVDITTLVNSQTQLADARYSLADARKNWYNALTQLTYATGVVTRPCNGGICEN